MKELIVGAVSVCISVSGSISASSYFLGSKLAEYDSRLTHSEESIGSLENKMEQYLKDRQEFIDTIGSIKVDIAVTKNNVIWLRQKEQRNGDAKG